MSENPNAEGQVSSPQVDISTLINMETAKSLQAMGYSKNVSEKACLFSQSNIDAALDWIMQHQNDPDFEEEAKIEVNQNQAQGSPLDPEEAKAKARELQEKMRKIHQEKQKQLDEEHEKMRIHSTKEMLKAQRAEEERQNQIFLKQKKNKKKKMKKLEEIF